MLEISICWNPRISQLLRWENGLLAFNSHGAHFHSKYVTTELGVLTWTQIEADRYENNRFLNKIKAVRGYNYEVKLEVI